MVLSYTTLGMLAAAINGSILLISLPAVFRGIGLKALDPGNINYLLWTIIGYMDRHRRAGRRFRPSRRPVRPGRNVQSWYSIEQTLLWSAMPGFWLFLGSFRRRFVCC